MVRANYAYSGSSYHLGQHRHDRALMILDSAYAAGGISRNLLFQRVLRELVNEEVNPYPLPFRGVDGGLSYGLLHTHDAINRDITRSAYVVEGVLTAEDPLLATVWAMAGEPICSAALPLWVKAGSVPVEFDGPSGSTLNLQARAYKSYLYVNGVSHDVLDTWRLVDERNLGLYPFLISLENQAFARGDSALTVWRAQGLPAAAEVSNLQNSIASWALTQQSVWGPPAAPQVTITRLPNNRVQLNWSQVTQDVFGRPISVAQYAIYGSEEPFYDRETGALIDVVSGLTYTLNVTDAVKFLQVRALVSP